MLPSEFLLTARLLNCTFARYSRISAARKGKSTMTSPWAEPWPKPKSLDDGQVSESERRAFGVRGARAKAGFPLSHTRFRREVNQLLPHYQDARLGPCALLEYGQRTGQDYILSKILQVISQRVCQLAVLVTLPTVSREGARECTVTGVVPVKRAPFCCVLRYPPGQHFYSLFGRRSTFASSSLFNGKKVFKAFGLEPSSPRSRLNFVTSWLG